MIIDYYLDSFKIKAATNCKLIICSAKSTNHIMDWLTFISTNVRKYAKYDKEKHKILAL